MSRRRFTRRGANTGMTDVYYQQLYVTKSTSADQTDYDSIPIPLPSPPTQFVGRGASILYELLKAELQVVQPGVETGHGYRWLASMRLFEGPDGSAADHNISDPGLLCHWTGGWQSTREATANGTAIAEIIFDHDRGPFVFDFEDGKGNGRLVARNTITLDVGHSFSAGATYAGTDFHLRLWYRWRKVPMMEYVGLLTEQMAATVTG